MLKLCYRNHRALGYPNPLPTQKKVKKSKHWEIIGNFESHLELLLRIQETKTSPGAACSGYYVCRTCCVSTQSQNPLKEKGKVCQIKSRSWASVKTILKGKWSLGSETFDSHKRLLKKPLSEKTHLFQGESPVRCEISPIPAKQVPGISQNKSNNKQQK